MNKIFPKPCEYMEKAGKFKIDAKLKINIKDDSLSDAEDYFAKLVSFLYGIECEKVAGHADIYIERAELPREGYELSVTEKRITVRTADKNGAIYALGSLIQLINDDLTVDAAEIKDKPYTEMRGVHFYLPARDKIESFKRIIDTMTFLKMNTVFLEIGGGMQYDRHPEINTAWERFCHQVTEEFPGLGKYRALQGSDVY